jgi:hypothetical protein
MFDKDYDIQVLMTFLHFSHITANVSSIRHISAVADAFGIKKTVFATAIQYQDVLRFNDVIRSVSSSNFNASSSMFSVPASYPNNTLYWMHVGIETPPDARPRFQMENTPLFLEKDFEATYIPTFLSKSAVVQLTPNTSVSIKSEANDSVLVTTAYWSSFQLNNLMNPVVAVYAETRLLLSTKQQYQTKTEHRTGTEQNILQRCNNQRRSRLEYC